MRYNLAKAYVGEKVIYAPSPTCSVSALREGILVECVSASKANVRFNSNDYTTLVDIKKLEPCYN